MTSGPAHNGFFKTELGLRVLSGAVMLVGVVAVTLVGGFLFNLLWAVLAAVLFYEWRGIVAPGDLDSSDVLCCLGLAGGLIAVVLGFGAVGAALIVLFPALIWIGASGAERTKAGWLWGGVVYCALVALCIPIIRQSVSPDGLSLVFFLFLIVWATDIAAYFAGRRFGGPKLMPRVSPKKTWSGALGGLAGSVFVAALFAGFVPGFSSAYVVFVALVVSIVSQAGDLFESWVKRRFGVKDSSNLIPGHGGFLDRLDGLIPASIPVAIYVLWGAG